MLINDNTGSGLISSMPNGFSLNIGGNIYNNVSDIAMGMVENGTIENHHITIAESYSSFGKQIGDFFNL